MSIFDSFEKLGTAEHKPRFLQPARDRVNIVVEALGLTIHADQVEDKKHWSMFGAKELFANKYAKIALPQEVSAPEPTIANMEVTARPSNRINLNARLNPDLAVFDAMAAEAEQPQTPVSAMANTSIVNDQVQPSTENDARIYHLADARRLVNEAQPVPVDYANQGLDHVVSDKISA